MSHHAWSGFFLLFFFNYFFLATRLTDEQDFLQAEQELSWPRGQLHWRLWVPGLGISVQLQKICLLPLPLAPAGMKEKRGAGIA